jgi:wyosine [tRNA(Phe)-imidazoG37] synthetase (radical SAM superfamily)
MALTHDDHDRASAGFEYVYPVVSRRARGISIGVNLNPNNACNWRCVYCQVPGLVAGRAPRIDVPKLERELATLIATVSDPQWQRENVPESARRIADIAIAGNGEPTSARELGEVLDALERQRVAAHLGRECGLTLITNGSLAHLDTVQAALAKLAALGGEVWCKLDAGDDAGLARLNSAHTGIERAQRNLELCARACPTWVQTLAFDWNGPTLAGAALERYCAVLNSVLASGARLRGVLLYGLARPSHQPEAPQLARLASGDLAALGAHIAEHTGLEVRVSE